MAAQIELRGFKDHGWKRSRFAPLSVNYELTWDNGTSFPEPCIDRIADTVGKTPKVYPYDNLRVELGGEP